MAGSRSLTHKEERRLVRHARRLSPRDGALVAAQLFLGFRISETVALTIGHVFHGGRIRSLVALPPRLLKGGYGTTRSIPVGPELRRALERYLDARAGVDKLPPRAPLFLSRERGPAGEPKAIYRSVAERIIKKALLAIGDDPAGLSTHSCRKSWALRLYLVSGHDLELVRDGLGHSSVAVTEKYLPRQQARLGAVMRRADWTRASRRKPTDTEALPKPASPSPTVRDALAGSAAA